MMKNTQPRNAAYYSQVRKRLSGEARAFCKNKNAVIFACNEAYAFCTYVSLVTFFKHSPVLAQQSDVYVYCYRVDAALRRIFEGVSAQVRVIEYDFPYPIALSKQVVAFSPASFARYEGFYLLDMYESVLYLDADVLVRKELKSLVEHVPGGIGMSYDPAIKTVGQNFFHLPAVLKNPAARGFNSGCLVLTRALPNTGEFARLGDWCYQKTAEWAEDVFLPDQAVLNTAVEVFNWPITPLSWEFNCPASSSWLRLKRASVIHSTGPRKFWCYYYFREWYGAYQQWNAQGGRPAVRHDSLAYQKFCLKFGLHRQVFFQLLPDFFVHPLKAIVFIFKKMLRLEF